MASNAPAPSGNGSNFIPSDTMMNRFRNFYRMATGSMSPEGQKTYWKDADMRYEKTDCKRCEAHRDWLLQYSPVVRFIGDNIKQLGGDLGKHNIRCRRCDVGARAGFDSRYGIQLCANWLNKRSEVEDAMAHEMVHAYDHLRFKVDWNGANLRHQACTEVCRRYHQITGGLADERIDSSKLFKWRV